jgi:hypothetical protein
MPHKKMPAIKEFHYEGVRGALGIDSGYQKILDVPGYEQVWWVWGHQRIAIEPSSVTVYEPPKNPKGRPIQHR